MADPLSSTASVVALVGLVGNILEGCLFVKSFAQDVKDAPRDILTLATDLATLEAAVQTFESLVMDSWRNGYITTTEEYIPVLEQCLTTVEEIKQKIKRDVTIFKGGVGGYWDRLKTAGKKLDLTGHCGRLNASVGRLQVVQNNLQSIMHHRHQKSLRDLKLSIHAASVCSSRIAGKVVGVYEQTDRLVAISNETENMLSAGFQTLTKDLQELHSSIQALPSREIAQLSWGPKEIAAATVNALKEHNERNGSSLFRSCQSFSTPHGIQHSMEDKTFEKGHQSRPSSLMEPSQDTESELYPKLRDTQAHNFFQSSSDFARNQSHSIQLQQRKFKDDQSMNRKGRRTAAKTWRLHLAICRKAVLLQYRKFSSLNWDFQLQLTMYNHLPADSPIFNSCRDLDIVEVQRLFTAGLASPFDHNENGRSLTEIVALEIFGNKLTYEDVLSGLKLLDFLFSCACPGRMAIASYRLADILRWAAFGALDTSTGVLNDLMVDAMRLILGEGNANPLDDTGVGLYTSLALEKTPIFEFFRKQDIWEIDWSYNTIIGLEPIFMENDRQMVADPGGQRMLEAINKGRVYQAIVPEQGTNIGFGAIHSLLNLAKASGREDISQYCETRISILLLNGHDARIVSRCPGDPWDWYPMSCTNFATYLGVSGLWISALRRARWSEYEIQELFDEEYYLGVPELLSCTLIYQTQGESRKDFVDKLSRGHFAHQSKSQVYQMSDEIGRAIGVMGWGEILDPILKSNSVYLQKSMPGTWPMDHEVRLIPGFDFDLPQYDKFHREIDWQDYIEAIAENDFGLDDKIEKIAG